MAISSLYDSIRRLRRPSSGVTSPQPETTGLTGTQPLSPVGGTLESIARLPKPTASPTGLQPALPNFGQPGTLTQPTLQKPITLGAPGAAPLPNITPKAQPTIPGMPAGGGGFGGAAWEPGGGGNISGPGGPFIQRPGTDLPGGPIGGPLQEFGPGNDLRSTQINPFTGERLQGVQQGTDALFRSLTGGPDLTQAALDRLRVFEEASERPFQERLRGIGQRTAALGRIGSGMTETELGRALEEREAELGRQRTGLAGELAFSEGAERRANLGAGQAFEGQLFGQGQGLRGEARQERGFQEDQARRAQDQEILRRQLEVQYEQYLRQLGLQGAGLYGQQAAAGQQSAADLIGGALGGRG